MVAVDPLIVVGSSAGGIEAIIELVGTLPVPFPAAIVIAQHLDPSRPSHLGEILARRSPLAVVTVTDQIPLESGTVYVVPANRHVEITDHHVSVLPDGAGRPKPSIDLLLTSAAEVFGEQLIAVILTGTGSDGTAGARAVHAAGGTVVIQNPVTAAYPGMPGSLAPETVDIVADLPRIGPILHDLLSGAPVLALPQAEIGLWALLDMVQRHTGIDFHAYKPATITRRLLRRIAATGSGDLAGYSTHLERHPEEFARLVSNFLIKVTEFMRDPELFAALRAQIIPELIAANRAAGKELRIWSAGCATGEEAYSLAILVCETLGDDLTSLPIKIFGTDLDADSISFARQGIYPASAFAHLPDELLARYFSSVAGGYIVNKRVRSLVVFGEHDLGQRAPFPQVDLVLCRNVLIYFSRELQQHALQLFAYALRDDGYLVLGRTETIRPLEEFFAPQLQEHKIYRRRGERPVGFVLPHKARLLQPTLPDRRRDQAATVRELVAAQQEAQLIRVAWDTLMLRLSVGVVVVDARYDIRDINIAARRLLSIHSPAIGEDFVHLAQYIPSRPLRAAIDGSLRNGTITTLDDMEVPHVTTGEPTLLQFTFYPQQQPDNSATALPTTLILVTDTTAIVEARRQHEQSLNQIVTREAALARAVADLEAANTRLAQQNDELQQRNADLAGAREQAEAIVTRHSRQMEHLVETNRALLDANEELARLNSEFRAQSERLQINAEQAQAAIEESETLNEEMQAANEELETLNEQLQAAIEELNTSNADLSARGDELAQLTLAQQESRHRQLQAVITTQEGERTRVARELHDDIGQSLTALVLTLGVIQEAIPESAEREQRILEDATTLAGNIMSGLRRVIADLRPPVLDDLGLEPALHRLGSELQARTGVAVMVQAEQTATRLPPQLELTLFRVAQEASNNIAKHAHATHASITLRRERGLTTLLVRDDGVGLPVGGAGTEHESAQHNGEHFGMLGMRERVALLNGTFRVESSPQTGTLIAVELPLAA